MSRKQFTGEQIIGLLREAEVRLSQGRNVGQACREMGITEQAYYRWRKEYGGMKTVQAKTFRGTGEGKDLYFRDTTIVRGDNKTGFITAS